MLIMVPKRIPCNFEIYCIVCCILLQYIDVRVPIPRVHDFALSCFHLEKFNH